MDGNHERHEFQAQERVQKAEAYRLAQVESTAHFREKIRGPA